MVSISLSPLYPVRRTIATSVSLRASTRVSSGFASLRHSSPSFGSRQACSNSNPSQKIRVGQRGTPKGARGFCGRIDGGIRGKPGLWPPTRPAAVRDPGQEARRSASAAYSESVRVASPAPIRFPPGNFKHSLTLFSKSFSSFPRGYLFAIGLSPVFSLGRSLPPDWGCIPKQPDSPTAPRDAAGSGPDGALTLPGAPFQGTWARSVAEVASPDYNSRGGAA
ncbi:hypothetical protein LUZ60_018015 [Juncus effusus]|nr:hypothetical protein LUZ60_018015 [Juncus effusus]